MAWVKLALYNGLPGLLSPILFVATGRFVGFYPLRQFAPVIHGNSQARGRIAMGSPRRKSVAFFHERSGRPGRPAWSSQFQNLRFDLYDEGFLPIALRPFGEAAAKLAVGLLK